MNHDVVILIAEAMVAYVLVLYTHSLRHRFGLAFFYAVLGGLTAVMSWVTDAGVVVNVGSIQFMVGSTVFYTALLLGVFVVYVYDGPRATRIAIFTVAGVSVLVPVIAVVLHLQMKLTGSGTLNYVPIPSLRINAASVIATILDLVFLAIAWEFLGKIKALPSLWVRSFLTLLGVMWLDVLMFATGAFAGTPHYLQIMQGTLISRFIICAFASPVLYLYIRWQNSKKDIGIEDRPILAILRQVIEMDRELTSAQEEILRRKETEEENRELIHELKGAIRKIHHLENIIPTCSHCKKIRTTNQKEERWVPLDEYLQEYSEIEFSHGLCDECMNSQYADILNDNEHPSGNG